MTEDIDSEVLISLVVCRPVLWDKTLNIFKDRQETRNAWREVCMELNPSFEEMVDKDKNAYGKEVLKRWQNLRDAYAKSKKMKETMKSGAACKKIKKYVFNDQLSFLDKLYDSRDTVDSLEGETEDQTENDVSVESTGAGEVDEDIVTPNKQHKRPISQPRSRNRKRLDEVDLKILKSLDPPPPAPKNYKLSFFESLLPHLETFDDSDMLQLKMGVLQVISNITEKKKSQNSQMFPQLNNTMPPQYNATFQSHHSFANQTNSMAQPFYAQLQPPNTYYPQTNKNYFQNATPGFQRNPETVQKTYINLNSAKQLPNQTIVSPSPPIESPLASDSCSNSPYMTSPQYNSEEIDFGLN